MKPAMFLAPLALAAALPLRALPPTVSYSSPKVDVVFEHPDKFADIRDQLSPTDKGQMTILGELKDSIVRDANAEVPAGDHLTMTFTDIRLAGDFEPWHGPDWDAVRIVKDIYFPYFTFDYRLTDASGHTLKQGHAHVEDMNFQMRPLINTQDPFRYEKDILREWITDHVKP